MYSLPKNTILFKINDNQAIAYDFDYFKTHFREDLLTNKIYFKTSEKRDSWIDFKKAIVLNTGSIYERISASLNNPSLYIDCMEIPATKYYCKDGRCKNYPPFDGFYSTKITLQNKSIYNKKAYLSRDDLNFDYHAISYVFNENDLIVTFPESIENAIISLNMIFYKYELLEPNKIIYYSIKDKLSVYDTNGDPEARSYCLKFNIYRWSNLIKSSPINPESRLENGLLMPTNMNQDCLIFYNGVLYTYTISKTNKRLIYLDGLSSDKIDSLKKVFVYKFITTIENMNIQTYIEKGIPNRYENSIDFMVPVCNSLIIYNGLDHEYLIEEDDAISYPRSIYSVNEVNSHCSCLSINFTGNISYLDDKVSPSTSNLLHNFVSEEIANIFSDVEVVDGGESGSFNDDF